ncbi:hypothetical protein [uncultured Roseobacter sp.]|uniref:hypothetical protein n=1 Tax=uncultured Roseobacter sp. TaxID=114847 RepID=UPI00262DC011|nr:hypothetical protein [uncultured Roseobacter sp.]
MTDFSSDFASETDRRIAEERAIRRRNYSVGFILAFLILVSGGAIYAINKGARPFDIAVVGFVAFSAVIVAFAAAVLWQIIDGKVDLFGIISEPDTVATVNNRPKASLSRFQFLVFTFVIAGLFLMLSIEAGGFVNIPDNVLILLGLSGGSFVVSKSVSQQAAKNAAMKVETPPDPVELAERAERFAKEADAAAKAAREAAAAQSKEQ